MGLFKKISRAVTSVFKGIENAAGQIPVVGPSLKKFGEYARDPADWVGNPVKGMMPNLTPQAPVINIPPAPKPPPPPPPPASPAKAAAGAGPVSRSPQALVGVGTSPSGLNRKSNAGRKSLIGGSA